MDVLSEIEIETLAVETQDFDQTVEAVVSEDVATLETDIQEITTFLDGSQNFDPYMTEWLANEPDADLAISDDAANWLAAFVQDSAPDAIVADDVDIVVTEDIADTQINDNSHRRYR